MPPGSIGYVAKWLSISESGAHPLLFWPEVSAQIRSIINQSVPARARIADAHLSRLRVHLCHLFRIKLYLEDRIKLEMAREDKREITKGCDESETVVTSR